MVPRKEIEAISVNESIEKLKSRFIATNLSKLVVYEKITLIQKGRRDELIADLEERTGIKINRVEIGKIDFLRDTVMVKIYFYEDQQDGHIDETFSSGFNN
jgi:O-succinylbenzoate synthase